jgi:hypothetical protein
MESRVDYFMISQDPYAHLKRSRSRRDEVVVSHRSSCFIKFKIVVSHQKAKCDSWPDRTFTSLI